MSNSTFSPANMALKVNDEHLLINTEVHRQKFKNVERDPRVTLTIWDGEDPYRFVEVRGKSLVSRGGRRPGST